MLSSTKHTYLPYFKMATLNNALLHLHVTQNQAGNGREYGFILNVCLKCELKQWCVGRLWQRNWKVYNLKKQIPCEKHRVDSWKCLSVWEYLNISEHERHDDHPKTSRKAMKMVSGAVSKSDQLNSITCSSRNMITLKCF